MPRTVAAGAAVPSEFETITAIREKLSGWHIRALDYMWEHRGQPEKLHTTALLHYLGGPENSALSRLRSRLRFLSRELDGCSHVVTVDASNAINQLEFEPKVHPQTNQFRLEEFLDFEQPRSAHSLGRLEKDSEIFIYIEQGSGLPTGLARRMFENMATHKFLYRYCVPVKAQSCIPELIRDLFAGIMADTQPTRSATAIARVFQRWLQIHVVAVRSPVLFSIHNAHHTHKAIMYIRERSPECWVRKYCEGQVARSIAEEMRDSWQLNTEEGPIIRPTDNLEWPDRLRRGLVNDLREKLMALDIADREQQTIVKAFTGDRSPRGSNPQSRK